MATPKDFSTAWDMATRFADRAGGARACGRVYVVIAEKADRSAARTWAKGNGKIWTGAGGHVPNALYVGYDNASGIELGRGEAFAAQLKARGVSAYCDAMED